MPTHPTTRANVSPTQVNAERTQRLHSDVLQYAAAIAEGESFDVEQFLREHPEFAEHLRTVYGIECASQKHSATEKTIAQRTHDADTSPEHTRVHQDDGTPANADEATLPLKDNVIVGAGGGFAPGRRFGDYELLSEIARGGMGVVYKAQQISLNRTVAVKMILAGHLAGEEDVHRFHVEAEAAANLDHPGIVSIYEVGCHEGQHYFSMKFIEGESLAERIAEGPLPIDQAVDLLCQIADAVHHAHQQEVIHRDLKPANVLVDSSGKARITDFGLAKRTQVDSKVTGTGQILGTPSFMPPEQASGVQDAVKATLDVYSLGAILYALLTGRPPFQAATPVETLLQVRDREPAPPRQLNSNVPRDLEIICLKCLRKEPGKRYASAHDLAEDLRRLQTGLPILARPASVVERGMKWARRRPVVTGLIAMVLLVSTIGVAGIAWQWREAEAARLAELQNRERVERLTSELLELYARLESAEDLEAELDEQVVDSTARSDTVASGQAGTQTRSAPLPEYSVQQSDAADADTDAERPDGDDPSSFRYRPWGRELLRTEVSKQVARLRGQPPQQRQMFRRKLQAQLDSKIGELRKVSPQLADRYQKLTP